MKDDLHKLLKLILRTVMEKNQKFEVCNFVGPKPTPISGIGRTGSEKFFDIVLVSETMKIVFIFR